MTSQNARPIISISEAQAYVRIETGEEEAVLAGLVRTASCLCETFLNQIVLRRNFSERVQMNRDWQRLRSGPVSAITAVVGLEPDGQSVPLPAQAYAVDIDSQGNGWVRSLVPDVDRVLVSGTAGMVETQSDVPEPIRQGVTRLVAHLYAARDGNGGAPPAAVTALWRPYRRMVLA